MRAVSSPCHIPVGVRVRPASPHHETPDFIDFSRFTAHHERCARGHARIELDRETTSRLSRDRQGSGHARSSRPSGERHQRLSVHALRARKLSGRFRQVDCIRYLI